jgi:hypothetical protein
MKYKQISTLGLKANIASLLFAIMFNIGIIIKCGKLIIIPLLIIPLVIVLILNIINLKQLQNENKSNLSA